MMFKRPLAISALATVFFFSTPVSGVCLPCHAAFRRPNSSADQRTLHARDPSAAGAIHIFNPSYRSVWFNDEFQLVTWNVTGIEPRPGDSECQVFLGLWDWNKKDYQRIYYNHPLAKNCSLYNGNTTVRVPANEDFKPAKNWVIVLYDGNSDSPSAPFTIAAPPKDQQQQQ